MRSAGRCAAGLALAAAALGARAARADGPPTAIDPAQVQGIERPAVDAGDAGRDVAAGLLRAPREMVRLAFLAGGVAAGLVRDEQVVPRVDELLSPSPGNVSVIPSLFLDTRRRTSVGAQMFASGRESGTRLSFGFGGVHDLLGEARMRVGFARPLPFVLSLEALADERSTLDYLGVGQEPATDARNRFQRSPVGADALYFEQRARVIGSAGVRVGGDFEVFLSSSFLRSRVLDSPGGGASTISRVFQVGSVPGAPAFASWCPDAPGRAPCAVESRTLYAEVAIRRDTRPSTGRPTPGTLIEGYAGYAVGTGDDHARFLRMGGRAAAFIPVLRSTNIFSPKIVVDSMVIPGGAPAPPFTALESQPDYRGIDDRVDQISIVMSFDYRFGILRYLGGRLFVDVAAVAPSFAAAFEEKKRVAGGLGVDLFGSATELGELTVSFSGEGARAFFTLGVPSFFGDRNHRR